MTAERRRGKPWKIVANAAKVAAALNVAVGYWAGVYTGHPVAPLDLIVVSAGFYAFFAPVDAALIIEKFRGPQAGSGA